MGALVTPNGQLVPTEMREQAMLADVVHAAQDVAWMSVTSDPQAYQRGHDLFSHDRIQMLWRIRNLARMSPVAKWTCRLGANYTFGTGVSIKCHDTRYIAPVLQDFWNDVENQRSLTGVQAQTSRFVDLFRDGDLFLVMFVQDGRCRWRRLDAALVVDIITDPNDVLAPRWYKVSAHTWGYDFKSGTYDPSPVSGLGEFVYLKDWNYEPRPGDDRPPAGLIQEGQVFHVAINQEAKFGFSELAASEDWLRVHKAFMEDRASIARALAQFAWKVKRNDTPQGIQAFAKSLQSSYALNFLTMWEKNPPQAAGATLVESQGSTREPIKVDTGASNASVDGEGFVQMAASGMGVYTHYLGFGSTVHLANSKSMELPAQKNYEWWQQLWRSVYNQTIQRQIDEAIDAGRIPSTAGRMVAGGYIASGAEASPSIHAIPVVIGRGAKNRAVDRGVTVEFPPIVVLDLAGVVNAISSLATNVAPINVESRKVLLRVALLALGIEDVDEVVEECFPSDNVLLPSKTPEEGVNTVVNAQKGGNTSLPPGERTGDATAGKAGAA